MIRMLREKKTGLYYQGPGEWTAYKRKALTFKDNHTAIACGRRLNRPYLELILSFTGAGRDIAFPLSE
jgi:hypothetical protein